jgi:hypothetical protein
MSSQVTQEALARAKKVLNILEEKAAGYTRLTTAPNRR